MIGAVILAAGESSRMGTQKLLLDIKGKPMIERVFESFKGAADEIIVVLGHNPDEITPTLKKLGVEWTVNPKYSEGMISTFKEGLKNLKNLDAVFLALGDQPFVDREFLAKAVESWKQGAKVVSPMFRGKKGHPVLFDRSLFEEILTLGKNQFIRDVIHKHKDEHRVIESGEWAVTDLDTPENLETIRRKF